MTEWAYKANEKRRSLPDTQALADEHGVLMRSAHRRDRHPVPLVRKVQPGDVVHFYYRTKKHGIVKLGSYRVLGAEAPRFLPAGEGGALVRIADVPENEAILRFASHAPEDESGTGYKKDPVLGDFTGFRIERIAGASTPAFEEWRFPAKGTLTSKRATTPDPDALLARITHHPEVMAGKACIRGMRVTVGTILGLLAAGRSEQEVLSEYPYLEALDLRAALSYAAFRLEEREIPLEAA